jgi:hypothetical protein
MILEYSELILCTIYNSVDVSHHTFIRHNHIIMIRHSICDFVNNLFHTQFIFKNVAISVGVVTVQVCHLYTGLL